MDVTEQDDIVYVDDKVVEDLDESGEEEIEFGEPEVDDS